MRPCRYAACGLRISSPLPAFFCQTSAGRAPNSIAIDYYGCVRGLQKLLFSLPLLALAAQAQTLAITHANVIDTVSGTIQSDTTVVIDGNRITRVAHSALRNPRAAQVIDAHGAYLIPGLDAFGTVQPGRIADLVLLEANPLVDIANTRKIVAVVSDGRYLSQEDLEQLRNKLKQLAATR
jgi:adenine deaminase